MGITLDKPLHYVTWTRILARTGLRFYTNLHTDLKPANRVLQRCEIQYKVNRYKKNFFYHVKKQKYEGHVPNSNKERKKIDKKNISLFVNEIHFF